MYLPDAVGNNNGVLQSDAAIRTKPHAQRSELERRSKAVFAPIIGEMKNKESVARLGRNLNIDSTVIEFYITNSRSTHTAGWKVLLHLYDSSLGLIEKVEALIGALKEFNLNIIARDLEQMVREAKDQENHGESSPTGEK